MEVYRKVQGYRRESCFGVTGSWFNQKEKKMNLDETFQKINSVPDSTGSATRKHILYYLETNYLHILLSSIWFKKKPFYQPNDIFYTTT